MFRWLPHHREEKINELSQRVAARSQPLTWPLVQGRIKAMTEDEARGYIRARAGMFITRELGLALTQEPLSSGMRDEVRERAMSELISMVWTQHVGKVSAPRRRAA